MASDFEVLVDLVHNAINDEMIAHGVFRVAESKKDAPRRVVWIPTEFSCQQVLMANPLFDADDGSMGDTLFTDFVTVECQIMGVDFEDACYIRRQVCNAVRQVMQTSSRAVGGAYQTELSGHSGHMWGGQAKIVQVFTWEINVPKPDQAQVTVREIDQTNSLTQDGVTSTDETLTILPPP